MKCVLILFVILLPSCTCQKNSTIEVKPSQVVEEFVRLSAGAQNVKDKKRIEELCTGDLRRTFERMSDDAFGLIYLNSNIKLLGFRVIDEKSSGNRSTLLYEVTVDNRQGTDPTTETNQREVELVELDGGWYIDAIRLKGTDRIAFTRGMIF